jgi:hypothetical protein
MIEAGDGGIDVNVEAVCVGEDTEGGVDIAGELLESEVAAFVESGTSAIVGVVVVIVNVEIEAITSVKREERQE